MKHFKLPLLLGAVASLSLVTMTGCVSSSTSSPVRLSELRGTTLPGLPPVASGMARAKADAAAANRRAQWVGDTVAIRVAGKGSAKARPSAPQTSHADYSAATAAMATHSLVAAQQGAGDNESARTFYATVTDVLPNGHLVVSREKLISSTESLDLLRFTATIDPRTLQGDNVVPSNALSSMRLESSEGELPAAGLNRFLLSSSSQ